MSDPNHLDQDPSSRGERRARRAARRRARFLWFAGGLVVVLAAGWWLTQERPADPVSKTITAAAPSVSDPTGCSTGKAFYAAPDGVAQNDGSQESPWDLQTALSNTGAVGPCDTVWLRGGTYRGSYVSAISGREGSPVKVRQVPGERATIDSVSATQQPGLLVSGSWAWFLDFEVTNSDPNRKSASSGGWPTDLKRGTGVVARGSHLKFISLVVHDQTRGFEIGSESLDTEVYGSLVYFNGWEGPNKTASGHGIDTHNRVGVRHLIDNIVFDQFSHGIIAYASDTDPTHNIAMQGNILFNNGSLSAAGAERDALIGGGSVSQKPLLRSNVTYGKAQISVGYGAGCTGAIIEDNVFAGPQSFVVSTSCDAVISRNTFRDAPEPFVKAYPSNTFQTTQPSGLVVRVRPHQYDPGRAHVAIFNWDKRPDVEVDLSTSGLTEGTRYEIRDAQNYFGPPVAKGVYSPGKVTISMGQLTLAKPVGETPGTAIHTAPEFAAFVVVPIRSQPSASRTSR